MSKGRGIAEGVVRVGGGEVAATQEGGWVWIISSPLSAAIE